MPLLPACSKCTCDTQILDSTKWNFDDLDFIRGIWYPAQTGDLARVKQLIESGKFTANSRDSAGYTALHYAVRNGHFEICKYLLDKGADINAQTRAGGATPLHRAVTAEQHEIAKFLLEKKADVLIQDNDGKTAFHRATEARLKDYLQLALLHDPDLLQRARDKGINLDIIR